MVLLFYIFLFRSMDIHAQSTERKIIGPLAGFKV